MQKEIKQSCKILYEPFLNSKNLPTTETGKKEAAKFIETYAPTYQTPLVSQPLRAFISKAPTLKTIAEKFSSGFVRGWITAQLSHAAKQWDAKDKIPLKVLQNAAAAVLSIHHGLTPPELMLYIAQITAGHYGKIAYGNLTTDDLLANLNKFYLQQSLALSQYYENIEKEEREKMLERAQKHAVTRKEYLEIKKKAEMGDKTAQELLERPTP